MISDIISAIPPGRDARCRKDARNGDPQHVHDSDKKGSPARRRQCVDPLGDPDAGWICEETERNVDVALLEVLPGLLGQDPNDRDERAEEEDLCRPLQERDVAPRRNPVVLMLWLIDLDGHPLAALSRRVR